MSKIKPNLYQSWSGTKLKLWDWLEENIGNRSDSFEINQSKLAEKFEVSRKAIQNALKTFIKGNLLKKTEARRGRGNHSLYKLEWTFKEENATPYACKRKPQEKNITKGRRWRYFAYQFRSAVENSSLEEKADVVVGKMLNTLRGKPSEVFESWLIHLKNWLKGAPVQKTLTDFFVFFQEGLIKIMQDRLKLRRERRRIQEQREERKKIQQEYQENPPPRSDEFKHFGDYVEYMTSQKSSED